MLWKKTTYWLMAMILFGSAGAGCVSEEEGGDGWEICDGCEDSPAPQVVDQSGVPVVEQPGESPTRFDELEPCAPQAVESDVSDVPELPAEMVDGECSLEQQAYDYDGDGDPDRITRWRRDGEVIQQVVEVGGRLSKELTFEVNGSGDVRRVHQRQHHLYSGTAYSEQEWTFDSRGRLTSRSHLRWREDDGVETLQHAQQLNQIWREGQLVARTEDSSYGDNDTRRSYKWEYDARGRLVEAVVDDSPSGETQRAVWGYEDDRPVAVERSIDGVTTVRHGWEYHDRGVVAAHEAEYGVHGLGESAADLDTRTTHTVDTYHTPSPYVLYSAYGGTQNPWRSANPQVDAQQDCYTLPSSVGHGYPHDEPAYVLGWGDEPDDSIEFASAYGDIGYYSYGQNFWYGHAGAGTPWPAGQYRTNGVVTSHLRYDAQGRMVDESLTHSPYAADSNHEVDRTSMTVDRRRRFGDGGLLEDQITVESGEEVHERSLRFERGDDGQLLLRELWQDDKRLAFQSWDHDAQGRIIDHEVHVAQRAHQYPVTLVGLLREDLEEPVHTASFERRFDERGREEFLGAEKLLQIAHRTEITTDHGEHGPLEETRSYSSEHGESASRTSHEYDADGHKIAMRHDYDDDGTIDWASRYVYEGEQLVEVVETFGNDTTRVTRMSYVCQ